MSGFFCAKAVFSSIIDRELRGIKESNLTLEVAGLYKIQFSGTEPLTDSFCSTVF